MESYAEKVVVVTGSAGGIGFALAKEFGLDGARVVVSDLSRDRVQAAVSALAESGVNAAGFACDVTRRTDVEALADFARDTHGRVDVVVNNAGVNAGYDQLTDAEAKDFDFNYSINTMGVANGIKHAVPLMNDGGSIVNVASVAGLQGVAYLAPYVASKWAVIGLTRTAAVERLWFHHTEN